MPELSRKFWLAWLFLGMWTLASCLANDLTSKDYSTFQTYRFEQTQGLGFCPYTDQVFSAEIVRAPGGEMSFAHSVLIKTGSDPESCTDGVALQAGCFEPQPQATRVLKEQETSLVEATFSKLSFHANPDSICDDLAVDPCVIEKHVWGADAYTDYICGVNRLPDDQIDNIRALLGALRDGG